jgi:hypothetical protein
MYADVQSRMSQALKHSCWLVFTHYLPKSLGNSDIRHSCFKLADLRKGNEIIKSSNSFSYILLAANVLLQTHLPYSTYTKHATKQKFHINTQECLSSETWWSHTTSMFNLVTSLCCNIHNHNTRLWWNIHSFIWKHILIFSDVKQNHKLKVNLSVCFLSPKLRRHMGGMRT